MEKIKKATWVQPEFEEWNPDRERVRRLVEKYFADEPPVVKTPVELPVKDK